MNTIELLRHELKHSGHSMTATRTMVCEILAKTAPLTMRELIDQLDGKVDRASIYRTVSLFEELGIVRRIPIGWKYKLELSDKFTHHHHHAHCLSCKQIVTLEEDERLEAAMENVARNQNFIVTDHHIELRGYCNDCKEIKRQ